MLLVEVMVENFRPFERASMLLPSDGLVLVAGANNAGKSALLSALDVAAGIGVDTQAWRRAGSASPARVAATFTLSADERSELLVANPQRAELIAGGAASQLQLVFEEHPGGNPFLAQVRGVWPGRDLQMFATTGPLENGGGSYGVKVMRGLLGIEDNLDQLQLMNQGTAAWGGPVLLEEALPSVAAPVVSAVMRLRSVFASRYYHFRALRPGTQRSTNLVAAPTLDPTGQNLAAVLLDLLTNRPEILTELRGLIAEIVPGIGELRIRTSNATMEVVFAAHDVELNLKDLGTGVEQLLMTLVVGLTEPPPFTMVIEEPETNLHHAAQRALLGLLKDWAVDRQIVAATHSPVLLDWSPAGDRLWQPLRILPGQVPNFQSADPDRHRCRVIGIVVFGD